MNTKIFNKVGLLAAMFTTMLVMSCSKTLDVVPYSSFTDATAFTTPARIELAMNGVYDAAQSGFYAGGAVRGYPFGAANVEQGDMRGEDMLNQAAFYQITYEASYNPTTANNVFMWNTLYALINKANLVIEGVTGAVSNGVVSSAVGNSYIAECRFLRGLATHELLVHFAKPYADGNGSQLGIVIRDFGINGDATVNRAKTVPRSSVATGYTFVLGDLDFAENNLLASGGTNVVPFRATKAAAIALKMRVKLHMRDWAGVITEGAKLVPASPSLTSYPGFTSAIGGHKLMSTVAGPFGTSAAPVASTVENIFSMKNDATDNPGVNGALASMFSNPNLGGRGLVPISPISWNLPAWRCDDLRRGATLVNNDGRSYYTSKYVDITNRSDANPLIRYAEVLLTLAEAEVRVNGANTKALQLLNDVRNRALPGGPGNFTTPPANSYTLASFANANAMIQAILDERRIEFLGEGKRWGDIHRNVLDATFTTGGIPAKMTFGNATFVTYNCAGAALTKAIPLIPYADFRFIWPIPLDEIQQNPIVTQNPGY